MVSMENLKTMNKIIMVLLLTVVTHLYFAPGIYAQSATESGSATESASASDEASASDSASSSDSASLPETLPQTGAADVFILLSAGAIFIYAGLTTAFGTKKVFTEFE